jgi:CRISPR/Cas system-associated exonuclease Cas4 (RecB family)
MSVVRIISPQTHLIEEVATLLERGGSDYARSLVVFPGKRPAHFLRKRLGEKRASAFIPPRLFSIDLFVDFLYEEKLGCRARNLDTIDAVAMLHTVHQRLNERLGRDSFFSIDAFLPLGFKLFDELEEVRMANLPVRRMREILTTKVQYTKFHSLAAYYEGFYETVEQSGASTRASRYRAVAEAIDNIDLNEFDRIVLAGFFAFTNVERLIITNLARRQNGIMIFQGADDIKERLIQLGLHLTEEPADEIRITSPTLHFIKTPDAHGQVLALSSALKSQLDRQSSLDERTVVVLPSSEMLFPVVHLPLSMLPEETYNISLGYPLTRTPVFGFLHNLMELVGSALNGKLSTRSYLRFLLHPYTKNIRFEQRSDISRMIAHRIEEYFTERRATQFVTLDDIETDPELTHYILDGFNGTEIRLNPEQLRHHLTNLHRHTIGLMETNHTIGEFARRAREALSFLFDHSTANLHPFFSPFAQRMIEVLDTMEHSLLSDRQFESPLAIFTFFREYIKRESVPFPGTPLRGLQVLGLLETRNLKFDTIYLLDANDDVLPSKPADDLLLPQPVRRLLGLETNREREKLSGYYFDLAIAGAKEVFLFYTETGSKEKSRFVQKLIWRRERDAGRLLVKELERSVKYGVNLVTETPSAVEKTEEMVNRMHGHAFTASQLDTYLACPLRFYYEIVLGLGEQEEVLDDVDAREVGTMVHKILARFFEPLLKKPLRLNDLDEERLASVIDSCFEERYGVELMGQVQFFKGQVKLQLSKFLRDHQAMCARSGKVVLLAVEQRVQAEHRGVMFRGQIDRVERRENTLTILDYKTGKGDPRAIVRPDKLHPEDSSTWREGISSFQLPLYMLLASKEYGEELRLIRPAYLFLGSGDLRSSCEVGLGETEEDVTERYELVERTMMKMIEEILDLEIPFKPTVEIEQECPRCPFQTICGTQWTRQ